MSTHSYKCIVCKKNTSCDDDSHVLNCGVNYHNYESMIAFCSTDCFIDLWNRMRQRKEIALQIWADPDDWGYPGKHIAKEIKKLTQCK